MVGQQQRVLIGWHNVCCSVDAVTMAQRELLRGGSTANDAAVAVKSSMMLDPPV